MDTIVYLSYVSKREQDVSGECSYMLREHVLQDYRLIKILIKEKIPGEDSAKAPVGSSAKAPGRAPNKASARKVSLDLFALGKRLRYRRNFRLQERAHQEMSEGLRQELAACLEERDDIYLCYDETVSKDSWTRQILPFSEFEGYLQRVWVHRLLPEACNHHFLVLGDVVCIREVLWDLAPRMKSLLWIAPDRAAEEELEDFVEEFYQETGLAVRLQFLPAGTTYGQFTIPEYSFGESVNVLDFTEEKRIPRFYPPKGSLWLDFASDSDKERRIRARGMACSLVSLRKQWKKAPLS